MGEATFEPVLNQQYCRPPLFVEAAQRPDQFITGDRVELRGRLVEQHERGPRGQRGAERNALEFAAGKLVNRTIEQLGDRERQRYLLNAARDCSAREAAVLEWEGKLSADRLHHDLRLWVLQQRSRDLRQVARAVLARV